MHRLSIWHVDWLSWRRERMLRNACADTCANIRPNAFADASTDSTMSERQVSTAMWL